MLVRILTSCTGRKAVTSRASLTLDDFKAGDAHLARREADLADLQMLAGTLYTGQQHLHLMRAVHTIRQQRAQGETMLEVEVSILSAGYGLVPEDRLLVPYEVTFAGMKKSEIRAWSEHLGIAADIRVWIEQPTDLALILLGDDYQEAAGFVSDRVFGAPTLLFCGTVAARALPNWPGVRKVVLSRQTAKRFRQGLVSLKGYLAGRLLLRMARDPSLLKNLQEADSGVLDLLDDVPTQLNLLN